MNLKHLSIKIKLILRKFYLDVRHSHLKDLRNQYEKKRDTFDEDSDEYAFFDMRQNAIKITSNTTYGLFGMGTFRFSNKQLAKAITTQGRLTLKVAQIISDLYLNTLK